MKWIKAVEQIEQALKTQKSVSIKYHKKYHSDDWRKYRVRHITDDEIICDAFRCSVRINKSNYIIDEVII